MDPDPTHVTYLSIFGSCNQNHLILKKNRNLLTICHLLLHTTVLQCREITFLFICSFIFCWIQNNNSGSRQKFRIHKDPDPIHNTALNVHFFTEFSAVLWIQIHYIRILIPSNFPSFFHGAKLSRNNAFFEKICLKFTKYCKGT